MSSSSKVAYFSMEIALDSKMHTYSGGLGILAGDLLRSASDLKVPMVGITLLNRKGYFQQHLDPSGWQTETADTWDILKFSEKQDIKIEVTIEQRTVYVTAWKYEVRGITDYPIPVYLLDTDLPENAPWDRTITDNLYGGDTYYRICQEVILGIGGVRLLRALKEDDLTRYHMNEGHSAFLAIELIDEELAKTGQTTLTEETIDTVRRKCVFTTHTPVPAGQDKFPVEMVERVLGKKDVFEMKHLYTYDGLLNMTCLALNLSHFVNGVTKRNAELSQYMFAKYTVNSITNGVHGYTWTSPSFQKLFDHYMPNWKTDNFSLRYVLNIPKPDIWQAHLEAKRRLFDQLQQLVNVSLNPDVFTICFARRAATYKRADLILTDLNRLKQIAKQTGPIQLIYAGKAHPQDEPGKELIKHIYNAKEALKDTITLVYIPNYDMELAQLLTAGVDLWLNTPEPPFEASGTSGMKAALNGVPSLSILDGWWLEGCIEDFTGWAIGQADLNLNQSFVFDPERDRQLDANALYDKLEKTILPKFYHDQDTWLKVMRCCIALNGSFFNTQRMLLQYTTKAYFE